MKNLIFIILSILMLSGVAHGFTVTKINLPTNDLVYNPINGKIYASVPGSAGGMGNSITIIDPVTGTVGPSVFVGSEPGALEISDDGEFLYVSLDGSGQVVRYHIPSNALDIKFSLGSDLFFGPWYAEDIAIQPGNPFVIAVSLKNLDFSPRHAGVAVYTDGVKLPETTPNHTGSNRIEFSDTPSRLYGYNNESTEFGFRKMLVDAQGVTNQSVHSNFISGFNVDIVYTNGLIYSTMGVVLEPENPSLVGTYAGVSFADAVFPNPNANRIYFLTGNVIDVYNLGNFTYVESISIPDVSGNAGSLIGWDNGGLAFRTSAGQVFILGSDFQTQNYLILSPPTGMYLTTQKIDLGIIIKSDNSGFADIASAKIGDKNITSRLRRWISNRRCIKENIATGIESLRCRNFNKYLSLNFGAGEHMLEIQVELLNGSKVNSSVMWSLLPATE